MRDQRTKLTTCRQCSSWQSRIHVDPARNPRAHSSVCTRAPVWNCRLASTSRCFMYHPTRRPRRMAFQRSRSRVAQLDPLAWIIESRSITTPRSIIKPTRSNLITLFARDSSIDRHFHRPRFTTGSIPVNRGSPQHFVTWTHGSQRERFPSGVSLSGWIVFVGLYSIGCMDKTL